MSVCAFVHRDKSSFEQQNWAYTSRQQILEKCKSTPYSDSLWSEYTVALTYQNFWTSIFSCRPPSLKQQEKKRKEAELAVDQVLKKEKFRKKKGRRASEQVF